MPPSTCLRSFSQLAIDTKSLYSTTPRLLRPQSACFSTSGIQQAIIGTKKRGLAAPPKKGAKMLNVKRGKKATVNDTSKRPAQGERKALRKRIVLSNNNALEVESLQNLDKDNVLSIKNEGKVLGLPDAVVDALRTIEAFKPSQGWSLFRRPAVLMRRETIQLAQLFKQVEEAGATKQKKTIRRILSGERKSGKSTLLLQGLTMGFLRDWFVISLPDAQEIAYAHTEYAPLPDSNPIQYTQDTYTANLLQQILKTNGDYLSSNKITKMVDLPTPLPQNATLKELVAIGAANPEASWTVFTALWEELSQPGRPQILLALDGLSHVMRNSEYLSMEVKPIHAHDLTLVRHFMDLLAGKRQLPNGGLVLCATSQSNAPRSPALEFCVEVAEAKQLTPDNIPQWNPYKDFDPRVMEVLKDLNSDKEDLDVIRVGGLAKEEARSIIEYYAESGLLRHQVNDGFVSEKWSLSGMGNIGELERTSVRLRV